MTPTQQYKLILIVLVTTTLSACYKYIKSIMPFETDDDTRDDLADWAKEISNIEAKFQQYRIQVEHEDKH